MYVPAGAGDVDARRSGRSGSASSHVDEVEGVDRHLALGELDGLAGPGHARRRGDRPTLIAL